jgi:FtsP/CotA-like multicopper oxidase with cupredoxin domain
VRAGEADAVSVLRSSVGKWVSLLFLAWVASGPMDGARAADVAFDLRIEEGRVPQPMRLIRVKQGDVVTLRWRTDRPMVVHLHGYDIELRVEPGTVATMTFAARATGRFPIVAHTAGAGAGDHAHEEAPLTHVEIYPN